MEIKEIFEEAGLSENQICWSEIKENKKLKRLIQKLDESKRLDLYQFLVETVEESALKYTKMTKAFKASAAKKNIVYEGNYIDDENTIKSAEKLLMIEVNKIMKWFDKNIQKNNKTSLVSRKVHS